MTQPIETAREALKPCPFCGGEASLRSITLPMQYDTANINVACHDCDAIGPDELFDQDFHGTRDLPTLEAEAVAAWNTRPDHAAAVKELVEGKREALDLANGIWRAEYRNEAPDWKPLDELRGIMSQIDNMYAGVRSQRDEARWRVAELENIVVELVEGLARARMLIGAGKGDDPDPVIRGHNVNQAWHVLHALIAKHRPDAFDKRVEGLIDGE